MHDLVEYGVQIGLLGTSNVKLISGILATMAHLLSYVLVPTRVQKKPSFTKPVIEN